jgi:PD-(D/E)XK nuclease superfamily
MPTNLFDTGIRPHLDHYLTVKSEEIRDYGDYWSASSAGYCMRLNILRRLRVPRVPEIIEDTMRTQRVFEAGHIFHEWAQRITKNAGLSIAQEVELQEESLMVRGHIDDLVIVNEQPVMLIDYKTANSQAFNYKRDEIGYYHKMQLGTYMYILRNGGIFEAKTDKGIKGGVISHEGTIVPTHTLSEGRILTISKDDLRMREHQLLWSDELYEEIENYWLTLNGYWNRKELPACTCLEHDGGFMGRRSKKGKVYNDYFYNDAPCSLDWIAQFEEVKEFIL